MSNKVRAKYFRVRDHKDRNCNHPRGLVILCRSSSIDNTITLGYSLCHPDDEFRKVDAWKYATEKFNTSPLTCQVNDMKSFTDLLVKIPHSLRYTANWLFAHECRRYLNELTHQMKD